MKKINKILLIILSCILLLGLVSCKKDEEEEVAPVEDISFLDYSLIRPENSSIKLLDEVSVLYERLMSASGIQNVYSPDTLPKGEEPNSETKEILIGQTNRPETKQLLDTLSSSEYGIAVIGNKLVIAGRTDSVTVAAVRYFVENYLGEGATGTLAGDFSYKAEADVAVLIENGKANYTIVRSDTVSYMNKDMTSKFYNIVRAVTGVPLPSSNDKAPEDPEKLQILFGNTAYKETAEVEAVTPPEGYTIDFIGNKVVIFAWTAEGMENAINAFTDMISYSWYEDADGKANLCILKERVSSSKGKSNYFKDVPFEVSGRYVDSIYDAYENTMMLHWTNANADMFNSYVKTLAEKGFSKYQTNNNDSISSVTFTKGKAMVHVYLLKRVSELRVITQNNAVLPTNPSEYTKVCEVMVTQMGLDYSKTEDKGGMGYLIRLEDGTFVVIDGGDPYDSNAKNLYDLMLKQTPLKDKEIVISAWFVTHSHKDHFGVYNRFAALYGKDVTVKMLVGNDISDYVDSGLGETVRGFQHAARAKAFSGCVYMKAHTGQQFFFPGFTMGVLYSHEDVYPDYMMEINSGATIVLDAVAQKDGTRFVFLADLTEVGAERLVSMYQQDMKCDVLQIGHHGNKGGNYDLYRFCDPDIALWPASSDYPSAPHISGLAQNKWIFENVETIIVSGDGNYTISFEEKLDIGGMSGSIDENGDYSQSY